MTDSTQHDLAIAELDPNLLSTPFGVQTNWHVITGAPCCGKTTLIDQLADIGFQTVAESAREFLRKMSSFSTEPFQIVSLLAESLD